MGSCYVCKATPNDMKKRSCDKFLNPDVETYKFGLGPLHLRNGLFRWLNKYAFNQDFKNWEARGKLNKKLAKKRLKQFQRRVLRTIGRKPYEPLPSGGMYLLLYVFFSSFEEYLYY